MTPSRINDALEHARLIRSLRYNHVFDGPGYLFSYQTIDTDIKKVEHGDHSEEAILRLESKK